MCTAVSFKVKDHYFGRNLDYECLFGEKITITPRNYSFKFRDGSKLKKTYAMVGMALPINGYPLYFDASNEKGLSMAGLNFFGNALYNDVKKGKTNIASFEFIPYILSQCKNIDEALVILKNANITNEYFSNEYKTSPLHWIVCDKNKALTVEQTKNGFAIYENDVGVLTNNPSFDIQMFNLKNYVNLSNCDMTNTFCGKIKLEPYSRGMGAYGLPGDLSSMSRFVKACFTKLNSVCGESEKESVNQFFKILGSVCQQRGCVKVGNEYEITHYTSCCNTDKGIFYYTTYENNSINVIDMQKEDLERDTLIVYDKKFDNFFHIQN